MTQEKLKVCPFVSRAQLHPRPEEAVCLFPTVSPSLLVGALPPIAGGTN